MTITCIVIIEMPFYRNLGAIRFESQIQGFQIFRAEPETTIFQSKTEQSNSTLQILAAFYQKYLHNNHIQFYHEDHKGASIVFPQCKPACYGRVNIDQLCRALLEATKVAIEISSNFPHQIGDFTLSQLRTINNKLVFIYLPVSELRDQGKRDLESVKGLLKLGTQMKDESNMSHKLLLKKLSKCKTLTEVSEEISYFYTVYGVSKSSNKIIERREQKIDPKKRDNKRKLNLFKMMEVSKNKVSKGKIGFSQSMHSSAPRGFSPLGITIPNKGRMSCRATSNSCSTRNSPFNQMKFKTINFNDSMHNSEEKLNEQSKVKKSLRKTKPNETIHTPVSLADQQKLMKKLQNKNKEGSTKKIETVSSQKDISIIKSEKEIVTKVMRQTSAKQHPHTLPQAQIQIQSQPQKHMTSHQVNAISIKFPSKTNFDEPMELNIESRATPSKAIHKNESIHVSQSMIPSANLSQPQPQPQPQAQLHNQNLVQSQPQPQPQSKKLKKKATFREQQLGSEIQIVDLSQPTKQKVEVTKTTQLKAKESPKEIKSKELSIPRISIENASSDLEEGMQTRKNSWNPKFVGEQTVRNSRKLTELMQKKNILDYMGQTVVNTPTYLKNYEKIFWELPLFFVYRAFYILRVKLARELQPLQDPQKYTELNEQNEQIGKAVSKLIKVIIKKLKKEDPNVLKNLKDFLNIDENTNCQPAMKSLLAEYISSLSEASSDYPELLQHQLEVVNSFLIAMGQKVDPHFEGKLQSISDRIAYLKSQLKRAKQFL